MSLIKSIGFGQEKSTLHMGVHKKKRTVRKLSTLHCQSSATQLENLLQKTALSDPMKLIDHPEGRTGA